MGIAGRVTMSRRWLFAAVVGSAVLAASCAVPTVQLGAPAQPATLTSGPATATPAGAAQRLNLDAIFPPGKGRDLVLMNCTTCHGFGIIVRGQRKMGHWETLKRDHRDRVSGLSDGDHNTLFTYLAENFNDTKPEPELPEWLPQPMSGVQ